jgi:predicted nucleotidyltransferase
MTDNLALLEAVARQVRPLLDELVFVGGAVAELYFTLPLLPRVRATRDVDAICAAATYGQYAALGRRLLALGFRQDLLHGDPVYRWRSQAGVLDLMPVDPDALGFSSPWYGYGLATAVSHELRPDLRIRILTPPVYLATKLAAYDGRGKSDPRSSHDLEDVVALLARRPSLVEEVQSESAELRGWIGRGFSEFLAGGDADELVAANLPRLPGLRTIVIDRIKALAG